MSAMSDAQDFPDIATARRAMEAGLCCAEDLVTHALRRIEAYDDQGPFLHAVDAIASDALEQARARDRERAQGQIRGPLHGIPILIKSNIAVRGMATLAGSLSLMACTDTDEDAEIVARLREAGAVILGQATMHELACGITNVGSLTGISRNPYDPARVPGGSSGGSAAAVAAGFACAAIGTDTGGSVRIPAAFNHLYGLRATQGVVSRHAIAPLSITQDVGGPLARSADDLRCLFEIMTLTPKHDRRAVHAAANRARRVLAPSRASRLEADQTDKIGRGDESNERHESHESHKVGKVGKGDDVGSGTNLRLGVLTSYFGDAPDEQDVTRCVRAAIDTFASRGITCVEVDLRTDSAEIAAAYIANEEFDGALAAYRVSRGVTEPAGLRAILASGLFHAQLERNLRQRAQAAPADPQRLGAVRARRRALRAKVVAAMAAADVDALIFPVVRRCATVVGETQGGSNIMLSAVTGLPALSLPAGFIAGGVPVGVEVLGHSYDETLLLEIARRWQDAMPAWQAPVFTPPLTARLAYGSASAHWQWQAMSSTGTSVTVEGDFHCDLSRARLSYRIRVAGAVATDRLTLALHAPAREGTQRGPVVAVLNQGQAVSEGEVPLCADWVRRLRPALGRTSASHQAAENANVDDAKADEPCSVMSLWLYGRHLAQGVGGEALVFD